MKTTASVTASAILLMIAATWMVLSIKNDDFLPVPQQMIDIGKYLLVGVTAGFVGMKSGGNKQ